MSNYFSKSQIDLLAKAKSEKKYIHLKNENEKLKEVMNIKNFNKLISMHNCWDHKNFSLVLNKNSIPFSAFSTLGNFIVVHGVRYILAESTYKTGKRKCFSGVPILHLRR